jgi:hypothetical protein
MSHIFTFNEFLNENSEETNRINWSEMEFETPGEKAVHDIAEETLIRKDLIIICEGDYLYTKLEQIISSNIRKPILEISGVRLYLYNSPFEFIKWDTIGASPDEVIETCYILSGENLKKI